MIVRLKQFLRSHRTALRAGLALVAVAVALVPTPSAAQFGFLGEIFGGFLNAILYGVAWIIYHIAQLGGQLLLGLTVILVWVAKYNGFIHEKIVGVGWTIVRDVCNMAFIIALLSMAFNMVFGLRKGGSLLTLIINAGLINFSKAIVGFVIDISQVVMLTFVNGFVKVAGGNVLEGLGFSKIFNAVGFGNASDSDVFDVSGNESAMGLVIITLLIALIMIYIALGVILTFIIVLVARIFKLWALLIASPVPFVKRILPGLPDIGGGEGNYWSELSKTAAAGPILAFWLWLVFTSVRLYQGQFSNQIFGEPPTGPKSIAEGGSLTGQVAGFSQAGSIENILGFIIFIGMLLMALQQAQSQANAMHGLAGKMAQKLRSGAHRFTMDTVKGKSWLARMTRIPQALETSKRIFFEQHPRLSRLLTKSGREQARILRDAGVEAAVRGFHMSVIKGKPKLAKRLRQRIKAQAMFKVSQMKAKDLEEAGAFDDKSSALFAFDQALLQGDAEKAIAVATRIAEEGWDAPENLLYQLRRRFPHLRNRGLLKYISHRVETRASKAKNRNPFRASSAASTYVDPDTGELLEAGKEERVAQADLAISKGQFWDVMREFRDDRELLNFSNYENNPEEIFVRIGNIVSFAKKVVTNAGRFSSQREARFFIDRWPESIRQEYAKKVKQMVAFAEKKGVGPKPEERKYIEALIRLFSMPDSALMYTTVKKEGNEVKKVYHYNIEKILKSVDHPTVKQTIKTGSYDAEGKPVQQGTRVLGEETKIENQLYEDFDATQAKLTESAQEALHLFESSSTLQRRKQMESGSDRPENEVERHVERVLATLKKKDADAAQREEDALHYLQETRAKLTGDRAVTKGELVERRRRMREEYRKILALFDDNPESTRTGIVDRSGRQLSSREVFERSRLARDFEILERELTQRIGDEKEEFVQKVQSDLAAHQAGSFVLENGKGLPGVGVTDRANVQKAARDAVSRAHQKYGKKGEDLTASGIAAGHAYLLAIGRGLDYSRAERAGRAAFASGIGYTEAGKQGQKPADIAVISVRRALTEAGFNPGLVADLDSVVQKAVEAGTGPGAVFNAIRYGIRYFLMNSASASGFNQEDATAFAESVGNGLTMYVDETANREVYSGIEGVAESASRAYTKAVANDRSSDDIRSDVENVIREIIKGRKNIDRNALIEEAQISLRERFGDVGSELDLKAKKRIDGVAGEASIQLHRAVGERSVRVGGVPLPFWKRSTPREKEKIPNRRIVRAHELLSLALSSLSDAQLTDSLSERVKKMSEAVHRVASAYRGYKMKYGEGRGADNQLMEEYRNLLKDLRRIDYNDPQSISDEAISGLSKRIRRIYDNYR